MTKQELRKKYLQIRKSITPLVRKQKQTDIEEKFFSFDEFKNCKTLFCYVSVACEVDTHNIIKTALSLNKKVAVPKCTDSNGNMDFYYISSFDDLVLGMYDILEPDTGVCKKVSDLSHGLCIVPGACFDKKGYRVGYGKGYYDRFLEKFEGVSVGLCFGDCITEKIPFDDFDKAVDSVIFD